MITIERLLFVLLMTVWALPIFAQLPVVQAKGGAGQNVNWSEIKAAIEAKAVEGEEEPDYFYNDCAQGLSAGHASSTLKGQGSKTYSLMNLTDDNPMTAWVEGQPGYGIGEWFEVKGINVNVIYNGYQSSPSNWKNNSRVKRFKVYIDGIPNCFLDLTDEMGAQYFELPHYINWENKYNYKFEIVEVYKGDKWDDVCISHIDHEGCCFASTTMIQLKENMGQMVDKLQEGVEILCINLEDNQTFHAAVKTTIKQRHLSLLDVRTASHQISITADHPLYIKNKGFVSLSSLMSEFGQELTWDYLVNQEIEVMVYDQETATTYFEKIESIEKIEGDFMTYTILSIDKASSYIANGFVNKTY